MSSNAGTPCTQRSGKRNYIVWLTQEGRIDWFELAEDEYRRLPPDDEGVIRSRVFPGPRLATGALLNENLAGALAVLEKGMASPEHDRFAASLADRT